MQWYGHISGSSGLTKTILRGTVKGGQKKCEDNAKGMDRPGVRQAQKGSGEQRKMEEETGCEAICGAPTTPAVDR